MEKLTAFSDGRPGSPESVRIQLRDTLNKGISLFETTADGLDALSEEKKWWQFWGK